MTATVKQLEMVLEAQGICPQYSKSQPLVAQKRQLIEQIKRNFLEVPEADETRYSAEEIERGAEARGLDVYRDDTTSPRGTYIKRYFVEGSGELFAKSSSADGFVLCNSFAFPIY